VICPEFLLTENFGINAKKRDKAKQEKKGGDEEDEGGRRIARNAFSK
jgi:hypothetical protein